MARNRMKRAAPEPKTEQSRAFPKTKTNKNRKSSQEIQPKAQTTKKSVRQLAQSGRVIIGKNTIEQTPQHEKPGASQPLPPCKGPQLHIFKHHDSKIEWLERLNEDKEDDIESHVFRAKIKGRQYAIKVFKDYDVDSEREFWETYLDPSHDPREVAYFLDPFYNECRAYGRIKEALDEKILLDNPAMPCYGYVLLSKEDETFLADKRDALFRLDSSDDNTKQQSAPIQPVRALVKKLGSKSPGVTAWRQAKICRDLQRLHKLRIYNGDLRVGNYRDGLLVDFSTSITEPHIILDAYDEDNKRDVYVTDIGQYKGLMDEAEVPLKHDPSGPLPEPNVDSRLRRRQREKQSGTLWER